MPTPPPPDQNETSGKNKIYIRENLIGPFLVHNFLGPRTPPPPSSNVSLQAGLHGSTTVISDPTGPHQRPQPVLHNLTFVPFSGRCPLLSLSLPARLFADEFVMLQTSALHGIKFAIPTLLHSWCLLCFAALAVPGFCWKEEYHHPQRSHHETVPTMPRTYLRTFLFMLSVQAWESVRRDKFTTRNHVLSADRHNYLGTNCNPVQVVTRAIPPLCTKQCLCSTKSVVQVVDMTLIKGTC